MRCFRDGSTGPLGSPCNPDGGTHQPNSAAVGSSVGMQIKATGSAIQSHDCTHTVTLAPITKATPAVIRLLHYCTKFPVRAPCMLDQFPGRIAGLSQKARTTLNQTFSVLILALVLSGFVFLFFSLDGMVYMVY